jgi:hypothetical protein
MKNSGKMGLYARQVGVPPSLIDFLSALAMTETYFDSYLSTVIDGLDSEPEQATITFAFIFSEANQSASLISASPETMPLIETYSSFVLPSKSLKSPL